MVNEQSDISGKIQELENIHFSKKKNTELVSENGIKSKRKKLKREESLKERKKERGQKDRILQLYQLCMTVFPCMQEAEYNLHEFILKCHSSPSQREGERQREEVVSLVLWFLLEVEG